MKTVLFLYDNSAPAQRALDRLVEDTNNRPGVHIHVLNVQPHPDTYGRNPLALEVVERLKDSARSFAAEICAKAEARLEAAGIACSSHPALGHVLDQANHIIKHNKCDTVVMGTRGMGGVGNLLLGSVAMQVVHGVPVPVLLVK